MGYSVIVPTMWKFEPFTEFLKDLVNEYLVREVIIINNDPKITPQDSILQHKKIKMFWFQEGNIGVNPAWNFGVHHATEDKICIMNDDIIFDLKIFNKLFEQLDEISLYGICPGDPAHNQPPVENGLINFVHTDIPYNHRTHFGFGQLMFLNKAGWTRIPDGLKIYWGDNFIFDTFYHKYNRNHLITNMFFHTPCATTSLSGVISNPIDVCNEEGILYNKIVPDILANT